MDKISFDEQKFISPEPAVFARRIATDKLIPHLIKQLLTKRQQQLMWMYYGEKKNMTQIAQLLNIHKSTVSRTLGRAVGKLRHYLNYDIS